MNLFHFLTVVYIYFWRLFKQYLFIKSDIKPSIQRLTIQDCYNLTKQNEKQLFRNYPFYAVCGIAENILILRDRKISERERKRVSLAGIMASLSDELLDEEGWQETELINLLNNRNSFKELSGRAKLLVSINDEFNSTGNINKKFLVQLQKAFYVQATSSVQYNSTISIEDSTAITKEKGGHANLLLAYLLDEQFSQLELDYVYQTGVLGQLMDDIFDLYEDLHQNIYTTIVKSESISQIEALFTNECRTLNNLVKEMPLDKRLKKKLIRFSTFIPALGFIAIDQFKSVEKQYGGKPADWNHIPRKELIVDMEKRSNQFKMLKYTLYCAQL